MQKLRGVLTTRTGLLRTIKGMLIRGKGNGGGSGKTKRMLRTTEGMLTREKESRRGGRDNP